MSPFKNFQVEEAEKVITPKNAVGIMQMLGENLFFDTLLALALMVIMHIFIHTTPPFNSPLDKGGLRGVSS